MNNNIEHNDYSDSNNSWTEFEIAIARIAIILTVCFIGYEW